MGLKGKGGSVPIQTWTGEGVRDCLPEDVRSKLRPEAYRRRVGREGIEVEHARLSEQPWKGLDQENRSLRPESGMGLTRMALEATQE